MALTLKLKDANDFELSFAWMEMNLILATLCWKYDMHLINESLDWLGESSAYVMWHKPALKIRFDPRK